MKDNEKSQTRKARRSRLSLLSRRRFIKTAGAATSAVTIGFGTTAFGAEELPRVNEDDPMAKALNYVHDAKTVDAAKRFSDRYCFNCALYAGSADDTWAKCSIFPGKVVAGQGWCSAWAPKQSG